MTQGHHVYHLSSPNVAIRIDQPTLLSCRSIERAALKLRFTWSFNMQGLYRPDVTTEKRGLLLHVFTIPHPKTRCYFLLHLLSCNLSTTIPRRYRGALPFVARTFLIPTLRRHAIDQFVRDKNN